MMKSDIENRFTFHPATPTRAQKHETLREACKNVAHLVNDFIPEGREKSIAVTKLEEAMMWANAGLARDPEQE